MHSYVLYTVLYNYTNYCSADVQKPRPTDKVKFAAVVSGCKHIPGGRKSHQGEDTNDHGYLHPGESAARERTGTSLNAHEGR